MCMGTVLVQINGDVFGEKNGGPERVRTYDLLIRSQVL
jgi:hypothetical protein